MKKFSQILVLLITIAALSYSTAFAAMTDVEFELKFKDPMKPTDVLRVTIDGKQLCTLTDAVIRKFETKADVHIGRSPYDILIEHTREGQTKTYSFQGHKMHDVELEFYFDGESIRQIKD